MQLIERIVRRLGLAYSIGWHRQMMVGGKKRTIPFTGGNMLVEKETWFSRYLAAFMKARSGLFVDIGVNLGQTLLKVKGIDPGRVYAGFEASAECVHYAGELVRANHFTDVTIIPVGLAETRRLVSLAANSTTDQSASIIPGFRDTQYAQSTLILVEKGDDVLPMLPGQPVGIVKIDVEGAELEVLLGLKQTLMSAMPIVTCEILPVYDAATEIGRFRLERQAQLLSLMQGLGYTCFRMRHDAWLEPVKEIQVHSDLELSDYAFLPPAAAAEVSEPPMDQVI